MVIDAWLLLLLFVGILLFFMLLGYPVGFGLVLTAIILMLLGVGPGLDERLIVSRMFRGVNSFVLLAIPFFLFAARIMNLGGMTERIYRFAQAIVPNVRGGLIHVNVLGSMIFAGMSGLATADAAGIGQIEYKSMRDRGYPQALSAGITAASATVGPIIPPSVPLVIYAILAGTSVGGMLIAGLLPGILISLSLMVFASFLAAKYKLERTPKFNLGEFLTSLKRGLLALGTPLILVGGILGGVFTPTEAAAVAVFYALILALFVYRELTWPQLWEITRQTFVDSAVILFLVAAASIYGFLAIHSRIPIILAEQILGITDNPLLILLMLNVFLLIVGLFLETMAALTILVPILVPLITLAGIDPIHFGIIMIFNLMIGLLTPPFGVILFVLSKALGLPLPTVIRGVVPFYLPLLAALLVITLFPQLTLFLPNLVFGR